MKLPRHLNRRNFISQTSATGLGLTIIPSLVLGGCAKTSSKEKNPVDKNPENWGLVTLYEVDDGWPQKPEDIIWGAVPGLDIDLHGNVWLLNRSFPIVQAYAADGKFLTSWGNQGVEVTSITNGPVDLTFSMENPRVHQIKVDFDGNVWIATWPLGVVYKCSPEGKVLLILGTYNEIGNDETHFGETDDMVITPTGEIFVADSLKNCRIVHFDEEGKFINAWGKEGKSPGEFACPHALGIDSKGLLYVGDRGNTRIQIFDQEGNFIDQWPNIIVPFDLWVTSEDDIWVCGYGPMRAKSDNPLPRTDDQLLVKFNSQGKVLETWTFAIGQNPGELNEVHGVALDSKGNVYLGDVIGKRIQKWVRQ